jgi:death-on-curing protein
VIVYLTPEQVLFIHSRLIQETGGAHGLRDLSMLLSALGRPKATFEERDLYPEVFTKTAALLDSLIRNHPFLDGNKRTAITAAGIFLRLNGHQMVVVNHEMVAFTLNCAQSRLSLDEIAAWIKRNSKSKSI